MRRWITLGGKQANAGTALIRAGIVKVSTGAGASEATHGAEAAAKARAGILGADSRAHVDVAEGGSSAIANAEVARPDLDVSGKANAKVSGSVHDLSIGSIGATYRLTHSVRRC